MKILAGLLAVGLTSVLEIPAGARLRIGGQGDIGVTQTGTYGNMAYKCVTRASSGLIRHDNDCKDAFVIESHSDDGAVSGGIALNGDSTVFWNSGLNNAINFVDEDDPYETLWFATSTGEFQTTSDERVKENIQPFHDSLILERISKLEPRTFSFRSDESNRTEIGLIAQEVAATEGFQHVVHRPKSASGYYSMSYDRLPLYLIDGVQTLMDKVDDKDASIQELLNDQKEVMKSLNI